MINESINKKPRIMDTISWRPIFSFLENLNTVKLVKRSFVDLNWVRSIKTTHNMVCTDILKKLIKIFKKRQGGVERLDFSFWCLLNASSLNRMLKLKVFRGLKEIRLDYCTNIDTEVLRIPSGIRIASANGSYEVLLYAVKQGTSDFMQRVLLFVNSLSGAYGLDFFMRVSAALCLEIEQDNDNDEEDMSTETFYFLIVGRIVSRNIEICEELNVLRIPIANMYIKVQEKDGKFLLSFFH